MAHSPRCSNEVIQNRGGCGESSNLTLWRTVFHSKLWLLYNGGIEGGVDCTTVAQRVTMLSAVLWISGTAALAVRTFLIYSVTAAVVVGTSWTEQTLDRNNQKTGENKHLTETITRKPGENLFVKLIRRLDCHRQREWTSFDRGQRQGEEIAQRQRHRQEESKDRKKAQRIKVTQRQRWKRWVTDSYHRK